MPRTCLPPMLLLRLRQNPHSFKMENGIMDYCKDAFRLLGIKVLCMDCPLEQGKCPRNIMEDAVDEGVDRAIGAMMQIKEKDENTNSKNRLP